MPGRNKNRSTSPRVHEVERTEVEQTEVERTEVERSNVERSNVRSKDVGPSDLGPNDVGGSEAGQSDGPPNPFQPGRAGRQKSVSAGNAKADAIAAEWNHLAWTGAVWKSLLLPGGALLAAAWIALESGWLALSSPAVNSFYYVAFGAGLLLAWRFHSSRVMFALLSLLLGHRALEFFSGALGTSSGPGRAAFELVSFLLPLNFIILSEMRERGLTVPAVATRLGILFGESVLVAALCRPEQTAAPAIFHAALLPRAWLSATHIPQPALLLFAVAWVMLLARFVLYRKPVESGMMWSLLALMFSLHFKGGVGMAGSAYMATAGLIIAFSVIENFYVLAYHDELTSLPSRRAFNDALLSLEAPYAIAAVDIDHFKSFNDTYGHETGDQVLRMVAGKLARVSGGGRAFRVGGEEFSILFSGKSAAEVLPDLELLRALIAQSVFLLRAGGERRTVARGPDRRSAARTKRSQTQRAPSAVAKLSVTVSIGVAESSARSRSATPDVNAIIRAADKALYQAKQCGRNRVVKADAPITRAARNSKRHIA